MSLGASIVLLTIVGVVIVVDLLSVVKKFDQQIEKLSQDSKDINK